jgi:hypothetical protein
MDATGGTNYQNMGTTQLLSVPYALHAKTAESVTGGGTGGGFMRYIGEQYGGGVIFHLWKDAQGVERGLVVDLVDLDTAAAWSNITGDLIGSSAQSLWDGLSNCNAIVNQAGHTNSAAAICLNSTNGGLSDWYLPTADEIEILYNNMLAINATLRSIFGATELIREEAGGYSASYHSSTEFDLISSWYYSFGIDEIGLSYGGKDNFNRVRAVRSF